jgi:hypothetical protein
MKEKHVNDFYLRLDHFFFSIFRLFRSFSLFNIHLTFVDATINFRAFDAFLEHILHSARFLVSNAKITNLFNQFLLCSNFCSRCQMRLTLNQFVFFYLIIVSFIIIIINYIIYIALLCVVESFFLACLHQIRSDLIEIIDIEWNQQRNQLYHVWVNQMSRLFFSSMRVTTRSSSRMNTHDDEWTRWMNRVNEQNEKEWKWREKKWWKKDELWLKKRANFTLFWSRI